MDPLPGAEELVVPHGCKGAGLGHIRVMLPSFAAVEEARGGCPPSGGNFPEAESPLLTLSHYFKEFSLSEDG